jgi:hypothetical protein
MTRIRSWVRANVWALIIIAIAGAASVWYSFAFDYARVQNNSPTSIVDVPNGTDAVYDGGRFSLSGLRVLTGDSAEGQHYGVVEGTDVVVVDVHVTPREDGDPDGFVECELHLLAPSPEGEREWWADSSNPTTYPDGNPDVFSCNYAGGDGYTYRAFFTVPAGGADDPTVLLFNLEALPLALHLH